MAISLECQVAIAPSSDDVLRIFSDQLQQGTQIRVDEIPNAKPRNDWTDRIIGVAWALDKFIEPRNILISSTVPLGGGLSSSAALGVSLALAFGGSDLANIAHRAETDFVGVPCGIMDQFASAHGGATLLDCRSLEYRDVALPRDTAVVAVNTMVKHELGNSAYRTRVEECAAAARALGLASLRDATSTGNLTGVLLKRARHVITENARTLSFAASADPAQMGRLMIESHRSLRDDYEVSCPELDFLVDAALSIPGVYGARMTGGGFGGSTINFLRTDAVDPFIPTIAGLYKDRWNIHPDIHVCEIAPGASQIF
jgi:galactokinase